MIAAAEAAEPSSAVTMWLAAAGVPVLLMLIVGQRAKQPLLPTRPAPFGALPPGPLVLLGFAVYFGGMIGAALIIEDAWYPLGPLVGLGMVGGITCIAHALVLRRVLRPRGTLARRVGLGLVVTWAALPVIYGLVFLIQAASGVEPQSHVDTILKRDEGWQWFVVMAVVVAPVLEEVTVRGLLYCGLRQAWGPRTALIVTSVLFGLMHIEPPQVWAPLAAFGVFLAYLVEVTGSLAAPIAAHVAFNALTVGQLLAS